MKVRFACAVVFFVPLVAACLAGQAPLPGSAQVPSADSKSAASPPAQAPAARVHQDPIGFSYSLPSDWQVSDVAPALPIVRQQAEEAASTEEEKKGIACAQMAMTAQRGPPNSVVTIVTLPFACSGEQVSDQELPAIANGAAAGLKQRFDLSEPVFGAYALGKRSVWIERAKGAVKGKPGTHYTIETVCTILKKGTVCWMAVAVDDAALAEFENGPVVLDGISFKSLVPASAFDKRSQ
jgi:hypothetical protein